MRVRNQSLFSCVINKKCDDGMMRRKEKKESTYEKNWKKTSDKSVASFKWIKKKRKRDTQKRKALFARASSEFYLLCC